MAVCGINVPNLENTPIEELRKKLNKMMDRAPLAETFLVSKDDYYLLLAHAGMSKGKSLFYKGIRIKML